MSARKNQLSIPRTNVNRRSGSRNLPNTSMISNLNTSTISSIYLPVGSAPVRDDSHFELNINYSNYLQAVLKKELVGTHVKPEIESKRQQIRKRNLITLEIGKKYVNMVKDASVQKQRKAILKKINDLDTMIKDICDLIDKKDMVQFLRGVLNKLILEARSLSFPLPKHCDSEQFDKLLLETLNNLNDILKNTVASREPYFEEINKLAALTSENERLKIAVIELGDTVKMLQRGRIHGLFQRMSDRCALPG